MACRRGFSLIETVLAVLILGSALASILSMITTSVHQVGQQKMQSAAGGFAAGQMNRFLFEEAFDDVKTQGFSEFVLDGTTFQYKLDVAEVPNGEILFGYLQTPYHDPRHGANPPTGGEPAVPPLVLTPAPVRPVTQLDSKFTAENKPILKDLLLTVRWHGPGEEYTEDNVLRLLSRKARL